MERKWTVILEPAEEGGFTSTIAEYPGAISEGDTEEEATEMVLEALAELIETRRIASLAHLSTEAIVLSA